MQARRAQLNDVPVIVELAMESVSRSPLPGVEPDPAAMADMARELVISQAHFIWVVDDADGRPVACVAAQVTPGWWFKKLQASVLMFYSRQPGAGIVLLRKFAHWVKSRPAIKLAVFSLEHDADPRIAKLLTRLGFAMSNPGLTYCRGLHVQSS